jgi:hypothetical protein
MQASVCVQASLSLHVVPSGAAGFEHVPDEGSHVPATWQGSDAAHVTGFDPVHVPLKQASVCVQASLSLQDMPSGAAGFEQIPVAGLHVPATWHESEATQVTVLPAVQMPSWQVSFESQAFPSAQEMPLGKA